MANDEFILNFYKKVAQNFGTSSCSTMQDQTIRSAESQFILSEIREFIQRHELMPRILELGCGNGHLLELIQKNWPGILLKGLEFTPELCELARSRGLPHTEILLGDMRKLEDYPKGLFDIVITERSLINLGDWEQQKQTLGHIHKKLSQPGRYICVESYMEPWRDLNTARKEVGLAPLKISVQNVYLKDKSRKLLKKWGYFKRKTEISENALSSHFFNARVLHPLLRPEGFQIKGVQLISYLNDSLAPTNKAYSPVLLRSYEKNLISRNNRAMDNKGGTDEGGACDRDPRAQYFPLD